MLKVSFHPKAFLSHKQNKKPGLTTRSQILSIIENNPKEIKSIVATTGLKYSVVLYHLRLLEAEKIITRKGGKKPYIWELTGVGQKQLM